MKWGIAVAALVAAAVTAFGLVRGSGPETAVASSHREAPVIADDPAADNTDLYAFSSPDRPDTVTLVANYIPLEEPAGGPNFCEVLGRRRSTRSTSTTTATRKRTSSTSSEFKTQDRERRTRSSTTPARSPRSTTRT